MSWAKMLSAVAASATMLAVAGYGSGVTRAVTGDDQQDSRQRGGPDDEGFDRTAPNGSFVTLPEARQ